IKELQKIKMGMEFQYPKGAFMNFYEKVLNKPMENPEQFTAVCEAVEKAIPKMEYGKNYELRHMVELCDKGLWEKIKNNDRRRAGRDFSDLVKMKVYAELKSGEKNGNTKTYTLR
ncbi:MAG: hypothetical protein IKP69_00135, partial [Oscillospiraceae bacterium]|nr:hypothetical protein [Oscillospiraceae bacterium]